MNRILSVVVVAAFAGAMPAVQAQSIPTMEACAKYAEADAAYNTVEQEAKAVRKAARQEALAAGVAAEQAARDAYEPGGNYNVVLNARNDTIRALMKKPKAVYEATVNEARTVLTQTYLAIYAEGGGTQSDVWDVMVKLLTHQRELCTEHYGL